MALHPSVAIHLNDIRAAAERYGIAKLEIFGSAMTPAFDLERSDVDFIVHYPPGYDYGIFLKRLQDFEDELATILGRPAQLVMTSALRKESFRQNADVTRKMIYAAPEFDQRAFGHQETLSGHN